MLPAVEERDGSEPARMRVLLPGLYAWVATVLYPVSFRGVGLLPRVLCAVTALLLVLGVGLGARSPRLGRALALHGFVAASAITWLVLRGFVAVDRLDPVRGAMGAMGWVVFALAWGAPREASRVPEDDPHALPGDPLKPRGNLSRSAVPVLAGAVVLSAIPLLLSWRITRETHALLGHAVAVFAAVAVVSAGAEVAIGRGRWAPPEPASRRLSHAMLPLVALGVVILAGLVQLLTT